MGRNVRRESEGGFGGSPTTCVGAVCGRMAPRKLVSRFLSRFPRQFLYKNEKRKINSRN